jgi:hypothetical protein
MLELQRIVRDNRATRIKGPSVRTWSFWSKPIHLSPTCIGSQRRKPDGGLIDLRSPIRGSHLPWRVLVIKGDTAAVNRKTRGALKHRSLRTFHIRMTPSKALIIIASGTKSRAGKNDLDHTNNQ